MRTTTRSTVAARPDVYFITDHYRGYPAVLARLAALRVAEARDRLARAWHAAAPRIGVKARAPGGRRRR